MDDKPRIRVNAKQTAKGLWTIEGTAELQGTEINLPIDGKDVANVQIMRAGDLLLREIKHTEKLFREDDRKLAGDEV